MQKHQQLQQALHDIISPNDFKMRPISLELIIAALEKKESVYELHYCNTAITFRNEKDDVTVIFYTPLQPLPQESVEKLLEIFK